MSLFPSIFDFILCSALIVYAGAILSSYGDRIAGLTGLSNAWIGLILMALVTSLAELIIKISAVTIVKAPILAPRDVLSCCVFNLLILSVLDTRIRQPLFQSFNPVLLSSNFWTSV